MINEWGNTWMETPTIPTSPLPISPLGGEQGLFDWIEGHPQIKQTLQGIEPPPKITARVARTPDVATVSNLEVLKGMASNVFYNTKGMPGTAEEFEKWSSEASRRYINPMDYATAVAGTAMLVCLGAIGVQAFTHTLSVNPLLHKVAGGFLRGLYKAGGLHGTAARMIDLVPVYTGLPATQMLTEAVRTQTGLANIGQLQSALQNIMPAYPAMIKSFLDMATKRAVTGFDVYEVLKSIKKEGLLPIKLTEEEIKDIDKGGSMAVTRAWQEERQINEDLYKMFGIKIEKAPPYKGPSDELLMQARDLLIKEEWRDIKDKGDVLYNYWQGLKAEGFKDDAEDVLVKARASDEDVDKVFLDRVDEGRDMPLTEGGFITRYVEKKGLLGKPLVKKVIPPEEIDLTQEEEAKMLLETIPKEADKIMTSSALGASAEPTVVDDIVVRPTREVDTEEMAEITEMAENMAKAQMEEEALIEKDIVSWVKEQGGIKHTSAIDDFGTGKGEGWNALPLSVKNNKTGQSLDELAQIRGISDNELYEKIVSRKSIALRQVELTKSFEVELTRYSDVKAESAGAGKEPLIEPPSDLITGPPAIKSPISFDEFMKEFPTDYRVGWRAHVDSSEGWGMSYEHRTGVPVYSECLRPMVEAGKVRLRDNKYYGKYVSGIFKGLSSRNKDDITVYMKTKQLREEAEPLTPELMAKVDEVRGMFELGFRIFNVAPEKYIVDYLPMLSETEQKRLDDIPAAWKGFPDEVIPFFQHLRKRVGTFIDEFSAEDLLRLYFNAGTWAKYRDVIKETGDVAKGFPEPAQNEIKKLDVFLTGGTSDFDKAFQKSISDVISRMTGKEITEGTDAMSALVNTVYLGTIAFNPGPVARNLTQAFHNWSETPAKWMVVGNKLYFSKEGQDILRHAGIETGFAPYVQRNVEKYYGKSLARKIINTQAKLRNIGMFLFQGIDHYDRGTEYLAEWARGNHFVDELNKGNIDLDTFHRNINLAGLHPTVQEMVKSLVEDKEWESMVDLIADYRQRITQYRYQREVRPQWMRTGVGKVAGQFMTWPTYAVSLHGGRYKRAYEAFKGGQKREGMYEIWKEAKWIAMVAATVYAGKKVGLRLWPWFVFLPTQAFASVKPILDAWAAAVFKFKGYDWMAAKKWRDFKWSRKIYVPGGVQIGNIVRGIQTDSALKAVGLPVYPKKKAPTFKFEMMKEKTTEEQVEQWLRSQ